ncbi:hypothetical protein AJ79_03571 [Helicocarpus griseus UAMH5409]|uniref:Uncharacterized protein n=1 Tax=Helicocarpus griseus UAMH5409 TaxID=1447875 RepID=A0A2B7XYD0_9EURO|nr:hypothetical protein AJ79_03571 [Helicocarpus griseus UAMH5409]
MVIINKDTHRPPLPDNNINDAVARAGDRPDENNGDENFSIQRSEILRVLQGVAVATKTSEIDMEPIAQWASMYKARHAQTYAHSPCLTDSISFHDWHDGVTSDILKEESRQIANIALGVAFLRERSRKVQGAVSATHLALVWNLIYGALTSSLIPRQLGSVSRSAQGFLAVPLCSLVEDGNIAELFRLHVWLPDGQRGEPDFAIHSHQPFAQSWILAGEGRDQTYKVEPAANSAAATHAEYALAWNDGKELDTRYKTHQMSSTVLNTGVLVNATSAETAVHTRGMTYTIPETTFHSTEVLPGAFHGTLFFFDSRRGFKEDARVLGPKNADSKTQFRDAPGITAATLASMVNSLRSWEIFMERGQQHARRAEWEHALREFNSALNICESAKIFPDSARYRHLVLGELGNTNRRFGRYERSKEILEQAIEEMGPSLQRVELSGELGVVYRHMNRLADAKRAFQNQYDTAKQLQFERAMCRAIGNLGMANYQLSRQKDDEALLELAIKQLVERVQIARHIKDNIGSQSTDSRTKSQLAKTATMWESIGLARLSLCYTAHGNAKEAIEAASESLGLSNHLEDSTVIAMSRFFYGRALLLDGQVDKALKQFNPPKMCTPAIALCKEPSEEHQQYLRELVDVGADMDLVDEQGYTALDYAVFNGDEKSEALVLEGLRRKLTGDIEHELEERQREARIRKGYRELFQEKLRPALLSGGGLQSLRYMYADALAADEGTRRMFDGLRFMWYSDFQGFGRLPRSSDNLAQQFLSNADGSHQSGAAEFVIFFSYRWINKEPEATSPDNAKHTQYCRMINAVEEFLALHPSVNRQKLGIWIDHACINQENPAPGVAALPMILVQCDAVISLLDNTYHQRAWCSVEVMMVQTLRKSYGKHLWYEQVLAPQPPQGNSDANKSERGRWILQEGPMELDIVMGEKHLTFEEDRPKVLFLERQSRLLG